MRSASPHPQTDDRVHPGVRALAIAMVSSVVPRRAVPLMLGCAFRRDTKKALVALERWRAAVLAMRATPTPGPKAPPTGPFGETGEFSPQKCARSSP